MRTIIKDYYSSFEGEHEISFVRKDAQHDELVFTMWYGHFYEIMQAVAPGPDGWTSLALQYHTVTPWWDNPDWQVPDVVEVLAQLDGLDRAQLPRADGVVLDEMVNFIREGMERGETLHIQDG